MKEDELPKKMSISQSQDNSCRLLIVWPLSQDIYFKTEVDRKSIASFHIITKTLIFSLEDSELEKCPACFGTNICPAFESGDIQFTGFTSWRFFQFFNVKNVFYGFWGSRNISIVVKV